MRYAALWIFVVEWPFKLQTKTWRSSHRRNRPINTYIGLGFRVVILLYTMDKPAQPLQNLTKPECIPDKAAKAIALKKKPKHTPTTVPGSPRTPHDSLHYLNLHGNLQKA